MNQMHFERLVGFSASVKYSVNRHGLMFQRSLPEPLFYARAQRFSPVCL